MQSNQQQARTETPPLSRIPDDILATLRQRMQAHKPLYFRQLSEWKDSMEQIVEDCPKTARLDPESRALLGHISHNLAGSGTTYGFPALSLAGGQLMRYLHANPDIDAASVGEMTQKLLEAINDAMAEG